MFFEVCISGDDTALKDDVLEAAGRLEADGRRVTVLSDALGGSVIGVARCRHGNVITGRWQFCCDYEP